MRWIIALLFVGVSFCVGATVNALASSLDDIQKSTLMLYSGTDGFCSGTLIAPDLILSAAHCTDAGNVNVRVQILNEKEEVLSEKIVYVKAVRTLKGWDAALFSPMGDEDFVKAFGSSVAIVDVATDEEAKAVKLFGEKVWAVGYPKAFQLQITDGLLSGTKFLKDFNEHPLYKISTPITGGNSGGGLYAQVCAQTGKVEGPFGQSCGYKLLGINVAGFRDVAFMNYAATHEAIMAVTQGYVTASFKEQVKLDKAGDGIDSK